MSLSNLKRSRDVDSVDRPCSRSRRSPIKFQTSLPLAFASAALAIGSVLTQPAQAAYPERSVRIVVGSPPSSPSDITARVLAERLGERWKQVVVVENKPGAGNSLAAQQVAQSPADGLTLLVTPDTVLTVNPHVYKKLKFDPNTGLVPVSLLATWSQVLVCNADQKIESVSQLVERSKAKPINYASGGAGSPGHLVGEMFIDATGVDMVHVPYKGPAPALQDVLGGQVDCGFLAGPTLLPHIQAGRLKALAVSSAQPSPALPNVPSLSKALGKPGVDASFGLLLMVPKGTPAAVVAELEAAVGQTMKRADVQEKLRSVDLVARGSSAAEASATLKTELPRWAAVVKRLNLSLD